MGERGSENRGGRGACGVSGQVLVYIVDLGVEKCHNRVTVMSRSEGEKRPVCVVICLPERRM